MNEKNMVLSATYWAWGWSKKEKPSQALQEAVTVYLDRFGCYPDVVFCNPLVLAAGIQLPPIGIGLTVLPDADLNVHQFAFEIKEKTEDAENV